MISVKICGLTCESDVDSAIAAGADRVGFVVVPTSPRHVDFQLPVWVANKAKYGAYKHYDPHLWIETWSVSTWSAVSGGPIEKFDELINWAFEISVVQLHGKETPADVADFKRRCPRVAVYKAIGVSVAEDLERAKLFEAADGFLLDSKPPPGADREGGFGKAFEWSILRGFDPGKPWVLSGGLTPANVAEAIRISGAAAVDVSSGVEASPGVKDPAKVKAFIAAAKAAG